MPITQYENYEQWRDATESLDKLMQADKKAAAADERLAIISELELMLHETPAINDLHSIMGIRQGIQQCIAHIERRK